MTDPKIDFGKTKIAKFFNDINTQLDSVETSKEETPPKEKARECANNDQ